MASEQDDLDLLLSLQDKVPDTPPGSPPPRHYPFSFSVTGSGLSLMFNHVPFIRIAFHCISAWSLAGVCFRRGALQECVRPLGCFNFNAAADDFFGNAILMFDLSNVIDPKRHYKKGDSKTPPKYLQKLKMLTAGELSIEPMIML